MSKDKNKKKEEIFEEDLNTQNTENQENTTSEESENNIPEEENKMTEEAQLKEKLAEQENKFLRLYAEFDNYKRRTSREKLELRKTAGQEVISEMLPVLDDFDRALKELAKSSDQGLLEGIGLIHSKLVETLRKKGLEVMNVKSGDTFDADLHEAVTQIPAPSKKLKGKIVDVIQKGYTLGEKIIRYPKVVTGA